MLVNRAALCDLIPHDGNMCLLDSVESWDEDQIICLARSHQDPDSPLRVNGSLPAVCGIEYGAQAMAVHGGLLAGNNKPAVGYLASVRNVELKTRTLNSCGPILNVRAQRLMNNELNQMYEFEIMDGAEVILSGRAAVFLQKEDVAE